MNLPLSLYALPLTLTLSPQAGRGDACSWATEATVATAIWIPPPLDW